MCSSVVELDVSLLKINSTHERAQALNHSSVSKNINPRLVYIYYNSSSTVLPLKIPVRAY